MKLKFLTALLLSTAVSVLHPLRTAAKEGCSNYPFRPKQTFFQPLKDGQYILHMTEEVELLSNDYQEIGFALFEAEILAELEIKKFLGYVSDESINQILSRKSYGIIKVGSCYEPSKFVRVTLGISAKTIEAHKEHFPFSLNRSPINLPF